MTNLTINRDKADRIQVLLRIAEQEATRILGQPVAMQITTHKLGLTIAEDAVQKAMDMVAFAYGISTDDMLGTDRHKPLPEARQMFWMLGRDVLKIKLKQLGQVTGNRNHATVVHGINTLTGYMVTEPAIRERYIMLKQQLKSL